MPPIADPAVLVGHATGDDAAVYRLSEDQALVSTVDYFTPIVDDPYDFGRIAAANALSDVYAMGARPLFALAIVGFPREHLGSGVLEGILRGGVDKAAEAGVPVVGGHSIDDAEPKYGLAVTGLVHPDRVVRNVGARVGDRLFLTKPLGAGIVSTAIKRGLAGPSLVARAVEVMATLNRAASEAMLAHGPSAATDVTGFGLLGHLYELTVGSGVAARVRAGAVPVQPGVRDLARDDVVPGGTKRNHAALEGIVRWAPGIALADQMVLADAQTSGGLLIAVPAERAAALGRALEAAGTPVAAEIGEVVPGDGWIEVVP
jgi:selenide,water dikinase